MFSSLNAIFASTIFSSSDTSQNYWINSLIAGLTVATVYKTYLDSQKSLLEIHDLRKSIIELTQKSTNLIVQHRPSTEPASSSLLIEGESIVTLEPLNLKTLFPNKLPFPSPLSSKFIAFTLPKQRSFFTEAIARDLNQVKKRFNRYLLAEPSSTLFWDPKEVRAAIVTCGGISPGVNCCIREIVHMLEIYGVEKVYGVKKGYKGVTDESCWMKLRLANIENIHLYGGSYLISGRGHEEAKEIGKMLMKKKINHLYLIGGHGTFRGAGQIQAFLEASDYMCSIVGIPTTIDNDIPYLDSCFGFRTVVAEATAAIQAAFVEATGVPRGVGIVKLLGRKSGFVSLFSTTASGVVDLALLPEMQTIELGRVIRHVKSLIDQKGFAVIVVTEGCVFGTDEPYDCAGILLKNKLNEHSTHKQLNWTIKYIDPSTQIRAVPANAYDAVFCSMLAHNAVHAAFSGYTGVTSARCNDRYVLLPANLIGETPRKQVNLAGRWFLRMVMITGQPQFYQKGAILRLSSFVAGS
jgi:6-phosphofructokinase 1